MFGLQFRGVRVVVVVVIAAVWPSRAHALKQYKCICKI